MLALAELASDGTGTGIRDNLTDVANPDGKTVGPDSLVEAATHLREGNPVEYRGAASTVNFDRNGDISSANYEVWEYDPPDGFTRRDTITVTN